MDANLTLWGLAVLFSGPVATVLNVGLVWLTWALIARYHDGEEA